MSPHPRLFFSDDQWPDLRAKIDHPFYRRDWENILRLTDKELSVPMGPSHPYSNRMSHMAGSAARCAFIHKLTGMKRYRRRAKAAIHRVLASPPWTRDPSIRRYDFFQLYTAGICRNLAMAYDFLAAEMTQAECRNLVQVSYRKAVLPFLDNCQSDRNKYLYGKVTNNWPAVLAAGAGLLMLALQGDGIDLSREIEIARSHTLRFLEWFDETGCAVEFGSYWAYPMGTVLPFLLALERNGWPGIFDQPSLKLLRSAYSNYCLTIGNRFAANFADNHYSPFKGRDQALMLASIFRDGRLLWWANQFVPGYKMSVICGPTHLEPIPPDDLPLTQVLEGSGVGFMRSSMTDPSALFLGIKGGVAPNRVSNCPHTHLDLNTIVLEGLGKRLIADPGYGHEWFGPFKVADPNHPSNSAPVHNTLLVDGKGQRDFYNPFSQLQNLSPNDDVDYIVARMEQGYGPDVKRFDRHAHMVGKRFFVVWDEVELEKPVILSWHFHAPPKAQLSTRKGIFITNDDVCLQFLPFGDRELSVRKRSNHGLPYFQFRTESKVASARVGWGLWIDKKGLESNPPVVAHKRDWLEVTLENRKYRLPVVRRRTSAKSCFNMIPDLDRNPVAKRTHRE